MRSKVIFGLCPSALSGVDTQHIALAQGLLRLGHDISALLYGQIDRQDWTLPKGIKPLEILPPPIWRRTIRPRNRDWTRYVRANMNESAQAAIAKELPATLIAGHLDGLWMPRRPGLNQIGVIHAMDEPNLNRFRQYHHLWDACVTVNEQARDAIKDLGLPVTPSPQVIVNGVDIPPSLSSKPAGPLSIIVASRIEQHQKRILDLPAILKGLPADANVSLSIIGDGELLPQLKQQIEALPGRHQVKFRGRLSHQQLLNEMERSHAFLLLSAYEGTPMALMEAMARGCIPISSTGCGGALKMLKTTFPELLFPPGDISSAVRIIARLTQEPEQWSTLHHKAYTAIKDSEHTLAKMANQYDQLIRSLIDAK